MSPTRVYIAKHFSVQEANELVNAWKNSYFKMEEFMNKRCCKCGVPKFEHGGREGGWMKDHPFFETNLLMLEYYHEQKAKQAAQV